MAGQTKVSPGSVLPPQNDFEHARVPRNYPARAARAGYRASSFAYAVNLTFDINIARNLD